jgi:hypothetical protein
VNAPTLTSTTTALFVFPSAFSSSFLFSLSFFYFFFLFAFSLLLFVTNFTSSDDLELLNNVTTSLDIANGTWAFFHIVVTDANQIIYDVQYAPLNDSERILRVKEKGKKNEMERKIFVTILIPSCF